METMLPALNAAAQGWAGFLWPILYQSAILAGIVYVVTRSRRGPAAWRFWLWMLVPLRLLIMPAMTISIPVLPAVQHLDPAQPQIVLQSVGTVPPAPELLTATGHESPAPSVLDGAGPARDTLTATPAPTAWTGLLLLWALGVLVSAGRLLRGWTGVRRMVADAHPETDRLVLEIARTAASGIGLQRMPLLLRTEAKVSPFVVGVIRPVVVLPQALVASLSAEQIRAVLTHEFAHLRRRDALWGWIMAICQVLYFFHPAIYVARRFMMLEREAACDECVLAHGHTRCSLYIASLINAADVLRHVRPDAAPLAMVAESFAHLRRRLMLLTNRPDPVTRPSRLALAALVVFSLLAIPGLAMTQRSAETATRDSLAPEAGRPLAVEVVDGDGAPVESAGVEVLANHRPIASGLTDDQGLATLTVPPDAIVQWVVAARSGAGLDYHECFPSAKSGVAAALPGAPVRDLPARIELVLDGARVIRIHAVDPDHQPIRDARFVPWRITRRHKRFPVNLSGSDLAAVDSDADGTAAFDWIPRETWNDPGTTFLVRGRQHHWPDAPETLYPGEEDIDVTARLIPNTTISGTVSFADGRPAANVIVVAEGRGDTVHLCRASTETAADGTYRLDVYPDQTYIVTVRDADWSASRLGITVGVDQPASDVDLALTEGTLIHGRMTWEDSEDRPVAGELVLLLFEDAQLPKRIERAMLSGYWKQNFEAVVHHRAAVTDADGRYSFRVGPGDYAICGNGSLTGNLHRPMKFTVPPEGLEGLQFDMPKARASSVLGTTAAPIRVRGSELIEYAFHPAWKNTQDVGCRQCHQPHREQPSVHGRESR
jgi:beta-lactamase regulating signal transducer with metallopeptidase domain